MPSTLYVKGPLFELILEGKKTSTLRLRSNVMMNDEFLFLCGRKKAKVRCTNVQKILLPDISDEIVKKEGFETKQQLISTLRSFYPSLPDQLVLIEFELKQDGQPSSNNTKQLSFSDTA
jgi:hypothetical protein